MKKLLLSCLLIIGCNTTPEIITEKFYDTNSTQLGYQIRSIITDNSIVVKHFLNGPTLTNGINIQDGIWCITINSNEYFFNPEKKNLIIDNLMILKSKTSDNYKFSISSSWLSWHPNENEIDQKSMNLDGSLDNVRIFNKQENRFLEENMLDYFQDLQSRKIGNPLLEAISNIYDDNLVYYSIANVWLQNNGKHTPHYMIDLLNGDNGIITKEILLNRVNQDQIKFGNEIVSNDQIDEIIAAITIL